ncbi:hypothetical protein [Kitasatospora sp. NBC_01539]|uniref:hypothetical protein n=1 Tax=Kitasatospora sp. NBC_01539 TaxID=2903577 RepID=UPI0038603380
MSPTPTAPPYGTALADGIDPLNTALGRLSAGSTLDALDGDLEQAEDAATDAAVGLRFAVVPDTVADTHRQLYTALERLATDLGEVRSGIDAHRLCAPSSALAETAAAQGLKDTAAALSALAAAGYPATLTAPQAGPVENRALENGAFVRKGRADGHGELTVDNGGGGDAVLTLVRGSDTAYSFYVAKGRTAKVTGIRDGAYDVYFTGGSDWDAGTKRFTRDCSFTKFDDGLDFATTSRTYSTWKLSLRPVVGGNASTTHVPADAFPAP